MDNSLDELTNTLLERAPKEGVLGELVVKILQKDFKAALGDIESVLHGDEKNVGLKLCWVICHVALADVPSSALSSPLEELRDRVKEQYPLAIAAYYSLSMSLQSRKQTKLALGMIENALEMASDSSMSDVKGKLVAKSLEILSLEMSRAEQRRESKQYIAQLQEKKEKWEKEVSVKQKPAPITKRAEPLSSKVILEEAFAETSETVTSETKALESRSRQVVIPWILVLCLAVVTSYLLLDPTEEKLAPVPTSVSVPEASKVESVSSAPPTKEKSLEQAVKNEKVDAESNSSLNDLQQRLENIKLNPEVTPQPVVAPESTQNNSEIVRYGSDQADPTAEAPLPEGIQTESLGSTSTQVPVAGSQSAQVAPGLKVYRTITKTKVMSSPSLVASTVDELEQGAKIQVVANLGRWLELRSNQGLRGYIYAQDAVPEN